MDKIGKKKEVLGGLEKLNLIKKSLIFMINLIMKILLDKRFLN